MTTSAPDGGGGVTPATTAASPEGLLPALPPPGAPDHGAARRRAWLLTAAVGLVVLIYLTAWSTYASVHTQARYRQLAPGATGQRYGVDFRLLSLRQSAQVPTANLPLTAEPGATFVVAVLELTQRRVEEVQGCELVSLVGTGGRRWESTFASTATLDPDFCRFDDVVLGQPYRYSILYTVPSSDVDLVGGVALLDDSSAARTQVLRPVS